MNVKFSIRKSLPGIMNSSRIVQALLTVLPVLTAGLYLLGLSYHQGYLAAFGIDDSIFPIASDRALFNGFISLFTITFPAAIYTIGAFGAFVVMVIVAAILSSTTQVQSAVVRANAWINRWRSTTTSPVASDLVDKSAAIYGYATGLFLIYLSLLSMAALAAKSGGEQAQKEMMDFGSGRTTSVQFFSDKSPSPRLGKLVICGEKYCALWEATGTTLFRHEVIDRIVTYNHALKEKSTSKPAMETSPNQ
nr:hypothetical protein [uncultured Rhodoferax sp.]